MRASLLWPLVAASCLAGCGGESGPTTYTVTGVVTFDGEPLATGDIRLVPVGGKGRTEGASIVDGRYRIETTAGPKRVEILANRDNPDRLVADMMQPNKMVPASEQYLPPRYNDDSELEAVVTSDGTNEFDFALKSNGD